MENDYCAKHQRLPVIKPESVLSYNLCSSSMASISGQSLYDPYQLPSNDEEYLIPETVAETTASQSNRVACLLTAARLHLNSPPELPWSRGPIDSNLNDYHSNPRQLISTFWIPDITDW